jgi:hypothetical protein
MALPEPAPRTVRVPIFTVVLSGVTQHFEARATEWVMAFCSLIWGLNALDPAVTFDVALPAWRGMMTFPFLDTAHKWGWACVTVGSVRIIALIINGSFNNTPYAAIMPNVRTFMALVGATLWFTIALSVLAAPTPGRVTYLLPVVLNIWCVRNAARDAGREKTKREKATTDAQL